MTIFALRQAVWFCWLLFIVVWVLAAASTKRTIERPPNQLFYRALLVVALILLGNSRSASDTSPLGRVVLPGSHFVVAIGLFLTVGGLALAFWARATLGGNWSGTITLKQGHTLVQSGPYGFVRHPIYTAALLMFLGSAVAFGTVGAMLALPVAGLSCVVKARQEEALLLAHFGEMYAHYRSRTRMLVPLVF
jgi:protein-S-isoprenylcysteine O-methyltransferase Ste14